MLPMIGKQKEKFLGNVMIMRTITSFHKCSCSNLPKFFE